MKEIVLAAIGGVLLLIVTADEVRSQSGSPGAGRATFQGKCAICHRTTAGANSIGPTLHDVFGRTAGTSAGYSYSPAMAAAAPVAWDEMTLDAYLKSPKTFLPGNKMNFPGVPSEGQRSDLIAFLKSISESP